MRKIYISADPGAKGFFAVYDSGEWRHIPIAGCDWGAVADMFRSYRESGCSVVFIMEEVHAIYGSSAESTFSFGRINGIILGMVMSLRIPYTLVQPKEWQREMWINADIVSHSERARRKVRGVETEYMRTVVDTKATSINCARRLFPGIDFRTNPESTRSNRLDDNKVDATLICAYAVRKNF